MSDEYEEVLDDEQEVEESEDRGDDVDPELAELDDDADEESDEAAEEKEPDDEPEEKPAKSKMVPHSRFNEVNDALKHEREARLRLEEELARARGARPTESEPAAKQQQEAQPQAFDFDAAEDRYMDAVMEGDTATARQIRGEIRAEERAEAERRAIQAVEQRREQEQAESSQRTLLQTAAELYKRYPQLNGAGDNPDADAIEMTLALRNKYINAGDTPADALRKAAAKVCGESNLLDDDDEEETPRQRMVKRNLERSTRIPPREIGAGERSRPVDYEKLSEDEFANLSETEKRKARGDFF